jgi:hypothetical protein
MWRSSVSHGLAVRDRRKSQDSGSEPALIFDNGRAKRGKIRLSGKALVNSPLLSFDEPSIGPATNSRIDF